MLHSHKFYLTLVRHGQSVINATPDVMGQNPDTELTEQGKEQARLLGERIKSEKFDFIYSSPYKRAYDTACLATDSKRIVLADELKEYNAGDWNGVSRSKTVTPFVRHQMNVLNNSFMPPNGESMTQVERRASNWLEDTILYNSDYIKLSETKTNVGESPTNIICFSHGMTIKCLLHYVMGFDKSLTWKINIDNTSVTRLYFGEEGWRVVCINDLAHLG